MARLSLIGLVLALSWVPLRAQVVGGVTLVKAELFADTDAAVPGQTFAVGVLLKMAPHWHTYWQYAGDAGLPSTLTWTLPPGVSAGPIEWPLPKAILEPGDIQVYAYHDSVLLRVPITVSADFAGDKLSLKVKADWLVCEEICVPGGVDLTLDLPVKSEALPANEALFDQARKQAPSHSSPPFEVKWLRTSTGWKIEVSNLAAEVEAVNFFPAPIGEVGVGHPQISPVKEGKATIEIQAEGPLPAVISTEPAHRGYWIASGDASVAPSGPGLSLWVALMYGFIGGLILNLMPCVLPVISLKIFGFVRQAGESRLQIFRHGLAFSAGVFAWFLGLAVLIVALKSGGEQVTWAFQFQNPAFILFISAVVFVFALNLFGVFEIVLPGQTTTKISDVASREGYSGSFFQGVFATLLATPCTAPFLGTALGFAFSQPSWVIFAMFGSVALGMASPYLALTAQPGWMKFLPKPGAWMERLKQFMGFPLLATLLWLLYVLGNQRGLEAVLWTGVLLFGLALALWIYGSFAHTGHGRWVAPILAVAIVGMGGTYCVQQILRPATAKTGIVWQPFSQATLTTLLKEGKPVFLDFTADWCITCKYNERQAINTPAVAAEFARLGVVPLKADWTNSDPEITAELQKFGRVGVPFYVFYPAGNNQPPVILPELLTEKIVLEALSAAAFESKVTP